ncbi:hypothetical protein EJB05_01860, partial [Eragrostis curvula]
MTAVLTVRNGLDPHMISGNGWVDLVGQNPKEGNEQRKPFYQRHASRRRQQDNEDRVKICCFEDDGED